MSSTVIEREQIPLRAYLQHKVINWERFAQVLLIVVGLVAWEIVGRRLGTFFLAPPTSLVSAFREMIGTGELVRAVLDSLASLLAGYGLAVVIGIGVGFLMGWYGPVGRTLNPFVSAAYVIPTAALVPVFIIWFGLGFTARVITVLLFCVFEILVSTYTGVRNVEPVLVDAARAFGANRRQLFGKVVALASLPYIFAGLRMGASRAVKGMVIAELLFAVTGIGGLIQNAANYYRTDKVFVLVIVLALLGVGMAAAIQLTERLLTPWKQERSS
jgi:NitT/TauT family transport system permease protein